jgi:hypothetical protein
LHYEECFYKKSGKDYFSILFDYLSTRGKS